MNYSNNEGGSWASWANLLIKETQRFSSEIEKIQTDMKDFAKEVLQIQKDIIIISSSKTEDELLKKDISNNSIIIHELKRDIESLKTITTEQNNFKIKILAGFTLFSFAVGTTIGILAAIGKITE